ncbi:efflux RND transporter periplasmic adaptor subunit [Myxococcota bacterium]|nr:efflux RND transporter periplasmic adaptor subunit [Myxococcota bacterium]
MDDKSSSRVERRRVVRWVKRAALVSAVALVSIALGLSLRPKPVPVDAAVATRGHLDVFIEEDGRTRVRERYVISAPITGELARIELEPGDPIEVGQVLATLAPPSSGLLDPRTRNEAEARLAAARARVAQTEALAARARAANENAVRALARAEELAAKRVMSPVDLERAQLEARLAKEELASSELQKNVAAAEVESIRAVLGSLERGRGEQVKLTSPTQGRVLRVLRESAGPVAPGTPLVELGDPARIEVVVDVLSASAVRIAVGARVIVDEWGGSKPLTGRVRLVEPAAYTKVSALGIEEQRVDVVAVLDEIPPGLGDGFRVEVKISEWSGDDVLTVPRSAVFRDRERWAVYAVADGVAELRPLEIGHRGRLDVEVLSGLAAGDRVILYPGDRVTAGAEVVVREAPPAR